ncbi:MAG: DNA polymerase domain-containing protein, partial [Candidatus Geothermarchaeales archaeon]
MEAKGEEEARSLFHKLSEHPNVEAVSFEEKLTELGGERKMPLLRAVVDHAFAYKPLLDKVRESSEVERVYGSDLLHVQQYIFNRLRIAPTSKARVKYDGDDLLTSITKVDDDAEIEPPPFTTLFFRLHSDSMSLTPQPETDPITRIDTRHQGEERSFSGAEAEILEEFAEYMEECDPDFLVAPQCDDLTFPYLLARVRELELDLQLGRDPVDVRGLRRPLPYWIRGRVALSYHLWDYTFEDWGLAGLVERARFSMLPPGIAWRWTANRVIDSRNCYELIQRGYVIKEDHGHYEWARPIRQVYERDVGGIIFAPRTGVVHESVGEIDFESMYPQLMVKYCISYETVKPDGIHPRDDALLPGIVGEILERRLYFKRMRKKFPEESREWRWCEQRQQSLKLVLVCAYGTAGCCWNRFGNVLAFEEINKRSREAMIKAVHLIQGLGYEVVYGDTDSLFIKKKGASRENYERLSGFIGEEIGLPIGLDHHYRFLLLLSSKTDPTGLMEAQKHYLGLLTNGEVVTRGVEIRRHDTPLLIKNFQLELIQRLLGWDTAEEVVTKGFEAARAYIRETIRKVMEGGVPLEDLVVTKYLRKPISAYKSAFPHVSAARQLTARGKLLKKGEKVAYVFVDADHENPLCRVQAVEDPINVQRYDTGKYRVMVLDAAETVLSQLGFSKREFG